MVTLKSLTVFYKQSPKTDLDEKTTVQHRVLCDWLRNIDKKLTRIEKQVTNLHKGFDILLRDDSRPEPIEGEDNDFGSGSRPIL